MKITSASTPLRDELQPRRLVTALWRHKDLLWQLAWRDLSCRCRSNTGAFLWTVGGPLVLLAVYTIVFNGFLGLKWARDVGGGASGFAVTAFCGMVVYFFIADCLQRAPLAIIAVAGIIRRSTIPLHIIPLATMLSAFPGLIMGVFIVVVAKAFVSGSVVPTVLLVVPVLLPMLAILLGTCLLLAGLGVYFRSCPHVIAPAMNILFFATPIIYDSSQVPAKWRLFIDVNPLAFTIDNVRRVLLWGTQPDWGGLGIWSLVGFLTLALGYAGFTGMRRGFSDVL